MSKEWYNKFHKKDETEAFVAWWTKYYEESLDTLSVSYGISDSNEYWLRRGFALLGWNAGIKDITTGAVHESYPAPMRESPKLNLSDKEKT